MVEKIASILSVVPASRAVCAVLVLHLVARGVPLLFASSSLELRSTGSKPSGNNLSSDLCPIYYSRFHNSAVSK